MGPVPTFEEARRINGWMARADHQAFQAMSALQHDLSGNLLEIGAFEGRSAVVLGGLLRSSEALHVCDPFDPGAGDARNQAESAAFYPSLRRETFDGNYALFHASPPVVHQCLSTELDLPHRAFRFVHVDGSHLYEHATVDLALAARLLVDGGIVAIDDYRTLHAFGVAAAAWQATGHGLTPLAATESKLYATWSPARYPVEDVEAHLRATDCTTRLLPFLDRPVVFAERRAPRWARVVRGLLPPIVLYRLPQLRRRLS